MKIEAQRISNGEQIEIGFEDCGKQSDGTWLSVYLLEGGVRVEARCPNGVVTAAEDGLRARLEFDHGVLSHHGLTIIFLDEAHGKEDSGPTLG